MRGIGHLLAIIHRDNGRMQAEAGLAKAIDAACDKYMDMQKQVWDLEGKLEAETRQIEENERIWNLQKAVEVLGEQLRKAQK